MITPPELLCQKERGAAAHRLVLSLLRTCPSFPSPPSKRVHGVQLRTDQAPAPGSGARAATPYVPPTIAGSSWGQLSCAGCALRALLPAAGCQVAGLMFLTGCF